MNILILSWRSLGHPNAGGAEIVTFEHAKSWVKAGHNVVLFSSEYKVSKIQETKDGVTIIRKGDYMFGVRWQALLWYFFGKHPKFDLVIDEFHGFPFFTPLFVKSQKLAFIHEVTREVWDMNPWPKPFHIIPTVIGKTIEPLIFKYIYKNIHFMTVSKSTSNDLIKWGIKRNLITIVHNGVILKDLKKVYRKETIPTAIYFGAISEDKGIFDALKIFDLINRKDEDWQFWIAGSATKEYEKLIKDRLKECGIDKKTKYFGYVSELKKFELMAKAHVLINPSVKEGWCLVNMESQASGTPVFGYNVPGMKDSVLNGKTGMLFEKGDVYNTADEVIKFVRNKNRYVSFVSSGKKWVGKFTWDEATSKSLELIESI